VPAYFAVGGMAGAAATLSAGAQLAGLGGTDRRMVQSGRVIALAGTVVGSVLLVADLGRPERFWHMLRVFRPSSPMNVGSWVLAGFGTASAGAAVLGRFRQPSASVPRRHRRAGRRDARSADGRLHRRAAGATAQPAWWHARRWLPRLFVASAASAGAGALELIPMSPAEERAVRTFAIGARAADLVVVKAMTRDLADTPAVANAYDSGQAGRRMKAAEALTAGALAASVISTKVRPARSIAGALAIAGSLVTRLAMTDAGASSTGSPDVCVGGQAA
jgi:protein NrfD